MNRLERAQEELPGWRVTTTHLRDGVLEASQPGTGLSIKAESVDELVAEVRMMVRIQEVARVLFADSPLALSDEYWPEIRQGLEVYVAPIVDSLNAFVSAPPPRVVRDTPKPPERPSMGSAVQRELDAKAKGYTGIPCDMCHSLETVRIGKCLRCNSCGSSGECG